ncbi:exosome complex component RRP43-like protein [Syncephalis pseudoplumigaleata]|uniref:Ribosomal RNA-processing protein 43 n=1 Tax=Syncephalis pseudoplumigaleata TaxID=1712513 RepID=A0A4P9Z5Q9_9FUNG|nr:exosome complex component RRP43-like protein [Syncephalis pseudoplumigaleata]|eukprot:RKP27974.1 exosome complex component RRP43-like protein [Syncephalis pseudoplumigaleata]
MTTSVSPYAFTAETFKRVQPEEYYRKILEQDVRPDGRAFDACRTTIVNAGCIGTAEGSAVVRIGDTTVVCGIKAEVAEPTLDQPQQGYFVPNVELGPLCSARFRPGPPGDLAQLVSERLRSLLYVGSSKVVVLEDLCIEPEQAVWVIYADLTCLNYDGNILDACVLALSAALKDTRIPRASLDVDEGIVRADEQATQPLTLRPFIFAATYGIYEGRLLLADPNASEEPLMASQVTVCLMEDGQLAALWKSGGGLCSMEQVQQCIAQARKRYTELASLVSSSSSN